MPPIHPTLRHRQILLGVAVGLAVAVSVLETGWLAQATGVVIVNGAAFQWSTPPTSFCSDAFTTNGSSVFHVRAGSVFSLSWGIGCGGAGGGNSTRLTYVIHSVVSSTFGFVVVSSDVPVDFGYQNLGYLNVSVRAPYWPSDATVWLTVTGGVSTLP